MNSHCFCSVCRCNADLQNARQGKAALKKHNKKLRYELTVLNQKVADALLETSIDSEPENYFVVKSAYDKLQDKHKELQEKYCALRENSDRMNAEILEYRLLESRFKDYKRYVARYGCAPGVWP